MVRPFDKALLSEVEGLRANGINQSFLKIPHAMIDKAGDTPGFVQHLLRESYYSVEKLWVILAFSRRYSDFSMMR